LPQSPTAPTTCCTAIRSTGARCAATVPHGQGRRASQSSRRGLWKGSCPVPVEQAVAEDKEQAPDGPISDTALLLHSREAAVTGRLLPSMQPGRRRRSCHARAARLLLSPVQASVARRMTAVPRLSAPRAPAWKPGRARAAPVSQRAAP
jgi:hypothetical protein